MKNNFITKIIGATLAFAMMIGGAVGINAAKEAKEVTADNFSQTYNYANGPEGTGVWSITDYVDQSTYYQVPNEANTSIVTIGGIFTGKTFTSDIVITINNGTYGSGTNPSAATFKIYNSSACTTEVASTQSGSLATSKTYVNTIYTVSSTNASGANGFSSDLAIKITKPGKTIRLNSITVAFTYTTGSIVSHSLTYAEGTNGTYDGTSEKTFNIAENGTHTVLAPNAVGISSEARYIFTGWDDGANVYQPTSTYTMGTENVTLTAQWVEGVGLSYDGNGAASGSVATSYVVSGGTQTVAANGFTAPSGKEFKEWNTLSTGLGTAYDPEDEITNFTSPLVLYAIWKNISHVDFDATVDDGTNSLAKSDITITLSAGTLNNHSEYRFNKGSTLTISRSSGKIGSIVFTCTANGTAQYGPGCFTVNGGEYTYSGKIGTWEGAANSVTFTASTNQVRATNIVVNYYEGSDVSLSKETLTLVVGGSSSTVAVSEISGVTNPTYEWSNTAGDDCVTLTNTTTDTVTVAPKGSVFASCTLTLSVNGDNLQSSIDREVSVYVARSSSENAYTVAEAKIAIDLDNSLYTAGARVGGVVSAIDGYNDSDSSISYWISSDGTTTNQLKAHHGKGLSGAAFESVDDVDLGATVVISGNLTKYNTTYELDSGNQLESYSITAETKVSKLDSHASLSYKYNKIGNGVLDTLTLSTTGISSGAGYGSWFNKTASSDAVYAGQSAGGNSSIQLRSDNNNSGLITTTSGGNATKVTIVWNSNTANNRTVNIYGKDTAYTAVTELYGDNAGTLLGTIKKGTSTELTISGDYQFIGIRSASGALYLDEIKIQWGEPVHYTFSDVAIRFGGSITPELWEELDTNEHNIAGFGVAWRKANTFEGLLKNNIANVETADGQGFYKLVSAKAEGHPDLVNGKYIWNFYLRISTIIDEIYDEHLLDDNITAVAYIKLNNGEVVYLKETTASVKALAQTLLDDDSNGYDNSSFDGSLKYLSDLTF